MNDRRRIPCPHCTTRFVPEREKQVYCAPACASSARRGCIHPAKLAEMLVDLRRIPVDDQRGNLSADAKAQVHEHNTLYAWRHLLELRQLLPNAPMADQVRALNELLDAMLIATGFATQGRGLVRAAHEQWERARTAYERAIAEGKEEELPESLKEFGYDEPPGAM